MLNQRQNNILIDLLYEFESSKHDIETAYHALINIDFNADPVKLKTYIDYRLENNDVKKIITYSTTYNTQSEQIQLMRCLPSSITVERSFSMLGKMLEKDRNFLPQNVNIYFLFYYNSMGLDKKKQKRIK